MRLLEACGCWVQWHCHYSIAVTEWLQFLLQNAHFESKWSAQPLADYWPENSDRTKDFRLLKAWEQQHFYNLLCQTGARVSSRGHEVMSHFQIPTVRLQFQTDVQISMQSSIVSAVSLLKLQSCVPSSGWKNNYTANYTTLGECSWSLNIWRSTGLGCSEDFPVMFGMTKLGILRQNRVFSEPIAKLF